MQDHLQAKNDSAEWPISWYLTRLPVAQTDIYSSFSCSFKHWIENSPAGQKNRLYRIFGYNNQWFSKLTKNILLRKLTKKSFWLRKFKWINHNVPTVIMTGKTSPYEWWRSRRKSSQCVILETPEENVEQPSPVQKAWSWSAVSDNKRRQINRSVVGRSITVSHQSRCKWMIIYNAA